MRPIRFRIRTLMVAVAIAGAAAAAVAQIQQRSFFFAKREAYHRAAAEQAIAELARLLHPGCLAPGRVDAASILKKEEILVKACKYHRLMADKYQSAAARPWLPISSGPPAPPGANTTLVPYSYNP
jgi:hypothetical protein